MSPKVSKEHMEQRRAKILDAAKQVFIEYGYERATMKHVMDAINISRGGLYQYFSNKEDLFEALLTENLSQQIVRMGELLANKRDSYWDLLLSSMFGETLEPDDEMDSMAPSNLEFFITGRNDDRRREFAKERYQLGLNLYISIIDAGQKSKEFSDKYHSETIARSIITFIDGLALDHAILPRDVIQLKEQSILFVEYLRAVLEVK